VGNHEATNASEMLVYGEPQGFNEVIVVHPVIEQILLILLVFLYLLLVLPFTYDFSQGLVHYDLLQVGAVYGLLNLARLKIALESEVANQKFKHAAELTDTHAKQVDVLNQVADD